MSAAIINLNLYVSSLPITMKLRTGEVVTRPHMSGNCNTILCALINMKLNDQEAQPSYGALASLIGGSVRTAIRCMDTLVRSGYVEKRRRGCRRTNLYRIDLRLWKRLIVGLKQFKKTKTLKKENSFAEEANYLVCKRTWSQPLDHDPPVKPRIFETAEDFDNLIREWEIKNGKAA